MMPQSPAPATSSPASTGAEDVLPQCLTGDLPSSEGFSVVSAQSPSWINGASAFTSAGHVVYMKGDYLAWGRIEGDSLDMIQLPSEMQGAHMTEDGTMVMLGDFPNPYSLSTVNLSSWLFHPSDGRLEEMAFAGRVHTILGATDGYVLYQRMDDHGHRGDVYLVNLGSGEERQVLQLEHRRSQPWAWLHFGCVWELDWDHGLVRVEDVDSSVAIERVFAAPAWQLPAFRSGPGWLLVGGIASGSQSGIAFDVLGDRLHHLPPEMNSPWLSWAHDDILGWTQHEDDGVHGPLVAYDPSTQSVTTIEGLATSVGGNLVPARDGSGAVTWTADGSFWVS